MVHSQCTRTLYLWMLDFLLIDCAHSVHTNTHQSICLLARRGGWVAGINSPPSTPYPCGMLLKMINCYFSICSLKVISHLTAFFPSSQTSHHNRVCRDEQRLWPRALLLALQLASGLSGLTLPQPQSLYLYFIWHQCRRDKGLIMIVRENSKSHGYISYRYLACPNHYKLGLS